VAGAVVNFFGLRLGEVVGTMGIGKEGEMTIPDDLEAAILRYHYVEKWPKNTIANQLGIHHCTVERVLIQHGVSAKQLRVRASIIDPFVPFIKSTLNEFPNLPAQRLYHMAKERGYSGSSSHFRNRVSRYRPLTSEDAYLRLSTLPGEQAQVDWASFGKINVGNTERKLYAFVMVLSWSRHIFLKFYLNQSTANFQRGHIDAFEFFGGYLPKKILYDNLKSAVLERIGRAIRFNPEILSLAAHYLFEPFPVEVRKPNQKGRVERSVRFARTSFWPARKWNDLDDLNKQAADWCLKEAADRRWIQDEKLTVGEAFGQEKSYLLKTPEAPFVVYDRKDVSVGKTPYASFDGNLYSVNPDYVKRKLTVFATLENVKICDGITEVANHLRCFEKGCVIEDSNHIDVLKEEKRAARKHANMDTLRLAAPSSKDFLVQAAERGHNLNRIVQGITELLQLYGAEDLEAAIQEALATERVHVSAVKQSLDRRRSEKGRDEPVNLHFQMNEKANTVIIPDPKLDIYDSLLTRQPEDK
jgi:transposase